MNLYAGIMPARSKSVVEVAIVAVAILLAGATFAAVIVAGAQRDASGAPQQAATLLRAQLDGAAQVPAVTTQATGEAVLTIDHDGTTLRYVLAVGGLESIATAHLNLGAPGVNGPSIAVLYDSTGVSGPGGLLDGQHPISGTVTLSEPHVAAMAAGEVYVSVLTTSHPDGAIRGQVGPYNAPERVLITGLSGIQQVPPVSTAMTGVATFTLGADGFDLRLGYVVTVSGAGEIQAAHIHRGSRGMNGPPLHTLFQRGSAGPGGQFDDDNPLYGNIDIHPSELLAVLAGETYVNIHTTAHADGEVRGQLRPPSPAGDGGEPRMVRTVLSGASMNPPLVTSAGGRAHMAFDEDGGTLHFVVNVARIAGITSAYLHYASMGAAVPPLRTLYDVTGTTAPGGEFGPSTPLRGTVVLDPAQAELLLAGTVFLTITTTDYPTGELRGRLQPFGGEALVIQLSGAEVVPPVDTSATGTLRLSPGAHMGTLDYQLEVATIDGIVTALLHRARRGANGPAVATLYDAGGTHPGGALAPGMPITGVLRIDAAMLVDLYGGFLYAGVQTADHPDGEIRGQIADDPEPQSTPRPTVASTPTGTEAAPTATATMTPDGLATPTGSATATAGITATATITPTGMATVPSTPEGTPPTGSTPPAGATATGTATQSTPAPSTEPHKRALYLPLLYRQP